MGAHRGVEVAEGARLRHGVWDGLEPAELFDIGEARSDARGLFDTVVLALGGLGSAYLAQVSERLRRSGASATVP